MRKTLHFLNAYPDPMADALLNLSPAQVLDAVEEIREMAGNDEAAHSAEDRMRHRVFQAIAAGTSNPRALAEAALTSSTVDFARWYA